jgi:hypothetical protein
MIPKLPLPHLCALLVAVALAGCYNGHIFPLPDMYQEGVTKQQFYQDKQDCHEYRFFGAEERAHYRECMEARGYTKK